MSRYIVFVAGHRRGTFASLTKAQAFAAQHEDTKILDVVQMAWTDGPLEEIPFTMVKRDGTKVRMKLAVV